MAHVEIAEPSAPQTYREPALACPTCKAPRQARTPGGAQPCPECLDAAKRSAASAGRAGIVAGGVLAFCGLMQAAAAAAIGCGVGHVASIRGLGWLGLVVFAVGVALVLRGRSRGKHAAWLRLNGVPLAARVVEARWTGVRINGVPLFRFDVQVAGPQGSYAASFRKLVPSRQAAALVGQPVRVRANPRKLDDVVQEE